MTPSQYRAGGANEEIKFAVGQTSLGAILVASTKKGVAAILLAAAGEGEARECDPGEEGSGQELASSGERSGHRVCPPDVLW